MTKKAHKLFWILLMIIILVSSAFVYFDDYRTETVEAPKSSNTTQPLQEGQLLTQILHCEGDGLNSIQIPFSTGNRVNHCMIYADLIVDGECAQSWELPAWKLKDGGFWSFPLDSRLNRCGEKRIEIALRTDGTPEESPSLCICSREGLSGLSLDGKPLENTMVCYKLQYKRGLDKLAATFLCHFVIAALFLLVLLLWSALRPSPLPAAKAFLCLWISMCKIVYLPFCLFLLLIPFERFRGGKKGKCLHAFALTFLVCTVNLLWLGHCRIFLNHLGASSPVQLAYILAHPLNYYTTVWRTFLGQGGNLILQTAGLLLGSANVQMSGTLLLPYLFLIAHKANAVSPFASSKGPGGKAGLRAVCTAVLLIITILTFTSVYLHWTPVSDSEIIGLQGRYFIPLLFPLYLLVTGDRTEGAESSLSFIIWWAAILVNLCAAARIMFTLL